MDLQKKQSIVGLLTKLFELTMFSFYFSAIEKKKTSGKRDGLQIQGNKMT